jgi:thioredoxin 1
MAVTELKEQEWQAFSQADYAVIDCYGDNCAACVMLAPVYDAVANELTGVAFGRINISVYPQIADQHGVNAMPTLLFFRKGELVHQAIGSMEREELLENVAKLLYE